MKTKINIRDILDIRSIVVGLEVKDKDELLETMVQLAAESGNVLDTDEAKERIFAREKLLKRSGLLLFCRNRLSMTLWTINPFRLF